MAGYQQEARFDAPFPNQQHHPHYPVQQSLVAHAPPPPMRDAAYDAVDGGEYYSTQGGGYYAPPQAPRLTAAAARASTMAAMYYNPSLHPQHGMVPTDQGAPWGPPYLRQGYPHPQQHQQLEHQLLLHHQLSKLQGPQAQAQAPKSTSSAFGQGYEAAAAAYGQQQHQPRVGHHHHQQQPQLLQHRPPTNLGWEPAHPWSAAQSRMSSSHVTPTGYAQHVPNAGDSYFNQVSAPAPYPAASAPIHVTGHAVAPHSAAQIQLPHPVPTSAAWAPEHHVAHHGHLEPQQQVWAGHLDAHPHHHQQQQLQQANPAHLGGGVGGDEWMAQGQPRTNGYKASSGYVETIPSDGSWADAQHAAVAAARADVNDHWRMPQMQQEQPPAMMHQPYFNQMPEQGFAEHHQQQPGMYQQPNGHTTVPQRVQDAAVAPVPGTDAAVIKPPTENNGGPAPPSPATLDKSAVPISGIGAEIVWLACAALLEPELLLHCLEPGTGGTRYPTTASSSTSPYHSTPATSPMGSHRPGKSMDWSSSAVHTPSPLNPQEHIRKEGDVSSERHGYARAQKHFRTGIDGAMDGTMSSEDSSASSSEPGTPPSSFPGDASRVARVAHNKQQQRDVHGLGLDLAVSSPLQRQLSPSSTSSNGRSSRGIDHSREAITSVLKLISPDWKWSVNDDVLPSLAQSLREGARRSSAGDILPVARPTFSSMRRSNSNTTSPTGGNDSRDTYGAALPGTEVSPAFRRFAHQVLAQTLVSPTAFMLSLMYALRAVFLAVNVSDEGALSVDAEALEIFAKPHSAAPFKIFTLGLMIANKHLDDNTFLNKTWNEVTGIPLAELNRMERWYLEKSGYEVTVPEEPWVEFLELMRSRTERKISSTKETRRIRVHTSSKTASEKSPSYSAPLSVSSVDEETCKRLLMSIEESLAVLGRVTPFELNGKGSSLGNRSPDESPISTMENDVAWNSPAQQQDQPEDSRTDVGRMRRPQTALHLHQHCHSAPAAALDLVEGEDIFDEEDGPYRPQPRPTSTVARKSTDQHASLSRWNSDLSRAASRPGQHCHSMSNTAVNAKFDAPLAPSILLDLLNRGQQHAHAAS